MRRKIQLKNIIVLTLAGLINAFGVTVFISPVKLYDSGISGTAMLLSQITPDWCSLSLFLLLLNIPLFIFGLKKTRKAFYSLFPIYNFSVLIWCMAYNRCASH